MPNILRHLTKSVLACLEVLIENNYDAYIVGGAVRDALLERKIHDFDICTNAKPETVKVLYECYDYKVIDTGIKHGTVTVIKNNASFEITTYRLDGDYLDGRHPFNVTYTNDLKKDLERRDFTINALASNDVGKVYDYFDGISDLNNKIIRSVGDADTRFKEDALRMLRAIRFSLTLGFEIEDKTSISIHENKELIKKVAIERVNMETERMLEYDFKDAYVEYKDLFNLAYSYDYEMSDKELNKIDLFPSAIMKAAYFLSFLDLNSYLEMISKLKLSNDTKKKIKNYIDVSRNLKDINSEDDIDSYFLKKVLSKYGLTDGYSIIQYICYLNNIDILIIKEKIDKIISEVVTFNDLDINGVDLMNIGFVKEEIKECENELMEDVLLGKVINNKEELIKRAIKIYKRKNK